MSGVSAGRLLMLIWKVIGPASSFETLTFVMSGAFASSPVESLKVTLFAARCAEPPSAPGTATTRAAAARSARTWRFVARL